MPGVVPVPALFCMVFPVKVPLELSSIQIPLWKLFWVLLVITVQELLLIMKIPASKELLLQVFPVIVVALQSIIMIPEDELSPLPITGADTPLLLEVLLEKLEVLLLRAIIP